MESAPRRALHRLQEHATPVTLFVVALLVFARKPHALIYPQFWAEDGAVFYQEAVISGLTSVFAPYAGYLHLVQRLIALPASLLPCQIVPAVFNYSAGAVLLFCCYRILSPRLRIPYRPLLAVALVLMPQARGECFLTLTNLQWVLAPLLVVLAVQSAPEKRAGAWADGALLLVLGLTGPFVVLCLPLFLVRWWKEHSRYAGVLACLAAAAAAVQLGYIALYGAEAGSAVLDVRIWTEVIGLRLAGGLFLFEALTTRIHPVVLALLSLAVPALILWLARGDSRRMRHVLSFLFFAAAMLAATAMHNRAEPEGLLPLQDYERYFLNVYLMTAWSLIACLSVSGVRRRISAVLLCMILLVTLSGFRWPPFVDYDWAGRCGRIGGAAPVAIPINPPGWTVELPPSAGPDE